MSPAPRAPLKLYAVETHPIQYKAPLFRFLAGDPRFDLTVGYAMIPDPEQQGEGFGVSFVWDLPLLEGYRHELLSNRARRPSVTRFGGCDTPGLRERFRRDRPDAVLVNGWVVKSCLQALFACRSLGIPCLVRGEANGLRRRPPWKGALHSLLLSRYSAWVAIGSANRDFYLSHGCPGARVFLAPYGVDNGRFAGEAALRADRRPALRTAFGLPEGARVFLFAGKLEDKKRPLDLLEAFLRMPPADRARAALLFAGDGPLREAAARLAGERRIPAAFAGFLNQSRLPDAYAAADVLVLPSDARETWGLVVNEAMASGRPAVVSRAAGCCRDLVLEGETGHSFDAGDLEGLAGCLRRYLADPGLAERQGAAAAARVADGFGFRQAAQGLYDAAVCCLRGPGPAERLRPC